MTWLALIGVTAVTAAILLVPGYLLAAILGLRGLWAWALAWPFGLSVVVIASVVAPLLGLGWGVLPVAAVAAVIAVGLLVARLLTGGLRRPVITGTEKASSTRAWVIPTALGLAAALLAVMLVRVVQHPGNISQTFDNIFHLNAIRFVLDTANASPLHVGSMTSESGGVWFYPSAWHAVASLVVQLTGADIAVATNALAATLVCLMWPAGAVLLTRTLFGSSPAVLWSAGVVSAALPSFPLLPLDYGVLYPFALGMSVVPAALAAGIVLLRLSAHAVGRIMWVWAIVVLGALPGLAVAHPGAFMAWLVLFTVAIVIAFVVFLRGTPRRGPLIAASVGALVYAGVGIVLWQVLRPPLDARSWTPTLTLGQGIGEAATLSYWAGGIPVVILVAVIVGLLVCLRRRTVSSVWAVAAFLVASLLYVAAIGFPWPDLRDNLTAAWYNNAPRLAAIVPVVIVPLAARGLAAIWSSVRSRIPARPVLHTVAAVAAVVVLIGTTQLGAFRDAIHRAGANYTLDDDSALVSADEMALLRRLPAEVPIDAVIAGSPWTGTGIAYAITGRQVLMPHTLMEIDADTALINDELDEAQRGDAVCAALARKGVEYVLDFGDREVHGAEHPFPGLDDLATSPAVELVDFEGDAALYRIVVCEGRP